ncbi:hypothetical protein WJX72_009898 [[Myrmecia] bisecta]|uniref:Uncharacterized protein n=1 Tax=[Myrmecia] bisecta TaxID=41462 RepID=A0AAW1R8Z8_9CHLO
MDDRGGQIAPKLSDTKRFLRAWAWKREHLPDKARFHRPYIHKMRSPGTDADIQLCISQAAFKQEGFASTVWDSSIVMAKYFERWAGEFRGKRCLDLSAGCGLVGIVLARLGADVTATDLGPNLTLLAANFAANAAGTSHRVAELRWGEHVASVQPPYDVVVACDVMYIEEAAAPLLATLRALSDGSTAICVAHGRNRPAEPTFLQLCDSSFSMQDVPEAELDDVYQTGDVRVMRLRKL